MTILGEKSFRRRTQKKRIEAMEKKEVLEKKM